MREGLQKIKIAEGHKINGFYTLLTNGSVVCLPNNEYLVPEYVLSVLLKKGIKFKMEDKEMKDGNKIESTIFDTSEI